MDALEVGKQIAARRKEQGLTQRQLASMLHVTDGAVSKWERGLNYPDLAMLEPLASALNTTVVQLLSLEAASNHEVANVLSAISQEEKRKLVKELKERSYYKIVIEGMLWFSLLIASKIFDTHHIYGLAQVVTMGMLGFTSTLFSFEVYAIRHLPKLE